MELEYKIKTSAELAGAEAAADSLERQIGKAKALKQDYSALETQLKTMRGSIEEAKASRDAEANSMGKVSDATADLTKKEEDAAEPVNILHENHRALHKILHLIGTEAGPGAGAALAGIGALAGGGIMIAIFAVQELVHWLHEAYNKANEFREMMESQIDLSPMVKEVGNVTSAVETARQKTDEFFDVVNRKSGESDGWKKIADAQIEQLKRVAEEQKKIAEADAERDKAKLEYLKATKQITDERFQQGMAAVEAMKQNRKDDADAGLSEKSISVLTNALDNIGLQQHLAAPTLEPANVKAAELKQIVENIKATIETNKKLQAAHLEKITGKDGKGGLQNEYDNLVGFMDNLFGESKVYEVAQMSEEDRKKEWEDDQNRSFTKHSPDFWDKVKRAREILDKIAEERQAESGTAAATRGLHEKLPGAEDAATGAEHDAKSIEQKIKQLETDQRAIEEELEKRQREDRARSGSSGAIAGAITVANAFKSQTTHEPGGAKQQLEGIDAAKHQLAENQKVGRALAEAATQAAKEHSTSLETILKALQDIRTVNARLQSQIDHR